MKRAFLFISLLVGIFGLSSSTRAASLFLYPQHLDLVEGESVSVEIRLSTDGKQMNAAEIHGALTGAAASIRSIDDSQTIIKLFLDRPSTARNEFELIGGIPNGFTGDGILGRLTVRGLAKGTASINFLPSSQVLENDGNGTALSLSMAGATITVSARPQDYIVITSQSHPDQDVWYQRRPVQLHWDLKPGTSYSYLVSRDITATPDNVADKPEGDLLWLGDIKLGDIQDGITYFSVKEVGGSVVSRYRLMQDSSLPEFSDATIRPGIIETGGKEFLTFSATDAVSGIDRFEVQVDSREFEVAKSPYILGSGYRTIVLRAYDRAGNYTEKIFAATRFITISWFSVVILLLILLILALLYILFHWLQDRRESRKKHVKV